MTMLPIILTSCGEGGGMSVRKAPAERPDVDSAMAARGKLVFPESEAFNYSSLTSGQTGVGRGDCKTVGKNGIACHAQADSEGSAWGEFQIGYCFDNTSGKPLDAAVKLRLKIKESRDFKESGAKDGSEKTAEPTTALATLRFFIKDTYGQILKTEELLSVTLDKGPAAADKSHEIVYDARFEPERGYYLILTGRCEVHAGKGESAKLSLDVSPITMEVAWDAAKLAAQAMNPVGSDSLGAAASEHP